MAIKATTNISKYVMRRKSGFEIRSPILSPSHNPTKTSGSNSDAVVAADRIFFPCSIQKARAITGNAEAEQKNRNARVLFVDQVNELT